ncbi:MAG: universal stress protein [Rhizobacter sp.]|nr:universal stress protein [Rhizobacter sp.]
MYKKIMIVVDEGAVARAAIVEGLELAKTHAAEVLFFHVLPNYVVPIADAPPLVYMSPEQHRNDVERLANRILASAAAQAQRIGVESTGAVGSNADAATCIANGALDRHCDLIVIGSHGRSPMQRLIFGSIVTRLIQFTAVPLLICKAAERGRVQKGSRVPVPDVPQREDQPMGDTA